MGFVHSSQKASQSSKAAYTSAAADDATCHQRMASQNHHSVAHRALKEISRTLLTHKARITLLADWSFVPLVLSFICPPALSFALCAIVIAIACAGIAVQLVKEVA